MLRRLRDLRSSLWLWPSLLAGAGGALGLAVTSGASWSGVARPEQAISPEAAGELLGASATTVGALLAVGFSIATVTVQLAASQYTPRLLRRFMGDPTTRHVLGFYTGALTYLLVALRGVRAGAEQGPPPTTHLAVWLGLALAVACVALLPFFLHHVARSIQVATIVTRVARDTAGAVEALPLDGRFLDEDAAPAEAIVRAPHAGYLQTVDEAAIAAALPPGTARARVEVAVGEFVLPGTPLVSLWPAVDAAGARGPLLEAFAFARERNLPQDALFGVRQLVDLALRALSPAVNDATTAVMALNELGAVAVSLLRAGAPATAPWRVAREGRPLVVVRTLSVEAFVYAALDDIVLAGRDQPRVLARALQILAHLEAIASRADAARMLAAAAERVRAIAGGTRLPEVLREPALHERARAGRAVREGGSPTPEPPVQ